MTSLIAACAAFLGSHFLLSHPLRAPLVARLGERGFLGLYSLVAFATLGWMVVAFRAVPPRPVLWGPGEALWAVATIVMLVGAVLFVGSLIGNPALPNPTGETPKVKPPRGVFAITRHPMMWGFALWGLVHIAVWPTPENIVLAGTIVALALIGAHLQDRKKARLQPDFWPRWQSQTSYWPFVALAQGRAQWAAGWPGTAATAGGVLVWLLATWAHMPAAGLPAGLWRWIA